MLARQSVTLRASPATRVAPVRAFTRSRPTTVRAMAASFYDLKAKDLDGNEVSMDKYKGKVVVVTNVACKCGYTSGNYKELVQLHEKYGPAGLEIAAFPCNQFGGQEPGSPAEIRDFTKAKGVNFDLFEKIDVNGPKTHPVYQFLKSACSTCAGDIKWNFAAKFIIDKDGNVVGRNGDNPLASEPKIKELLAA